MIGERIEASHPFPIGAALILAAGLALAAVGLGTGNRDVAIGGALPIAAGAMLLIWGIGRPFAARFREDGLLVEGQGEPVLVPYASIRNIKVGGRLANPKGPDRGRRPIEILHDSGILRIPSRSSFPTHAIVRFLADRIPDRGSREVNPALADFLRVQEEKFGPEHVYTFRATDRTWKSSLGGLRAFACGVILGGGAWIFLGTRGIGSDGWSPAGIVALIFGLLLFAASFSSFQTTGQTRKLRKNAGLVIGPGGMAMIQGSIQGELRWAELLEARFRDGPRLLQASHGHGIPGIVLRVKGAEIVIADVYDRPLYIIHDLIQMSAELTEPVDVEP